MRKSSSSSSYCSFCCSGGGSQQQRQQLLPRRRLLHHPANNQPLHRGGNKRSMSTMARWFSGIILTVVSLSLSISFWWLPYYNIGAGRRTAIAGNIMARTTSTTTTTTTTTSRFGPALTASSASSRRTKSKQQEVADDEELLRNEPIQQGGPQHLRTQQQHVAADDEDGGEMMKGLVANEELADGAPVSKTGSGNSWPLLDVRADQSPPVAVHHDATDPDSSAYGHPNLPFGYRSWSEVTDWAARFPTVDDRVQLYMTNWYAPPCGEKGINKNPEALVRYTTTTTSKTQGSGASVETMRFVEARTEKEKKRGPLRTFIINATVGFDELHYTNAKMAAIRECDNAYCHDLVKYLFPAIPKADEHLPILFQFSDAEKTRAYSVTKSKTVAYPNTPLFKKFRYSLTPSERARVTGPCRELPRPVPVVTIDATEEHTVLTTSQPIIFKLKMQRHYGYLTAVPEADRPWSAKQNRAIFRGQFTGKIPAHHHPTNMTAMEQCKLLPRCQLVYASVASSLVDAKLALPVLEARKDFPTVLDGVELYSERVSLPDMLSYKAIIMLEGNDVSSGLKWALFSNSVVMAQSPTKTSWAMEELLEPWQHYIPLADDLSDVEEKMQWVVDNDVEAQEIAQRGRLWISDLVFHPDADRDEANIFREIFERYKLHFARDDSLLEGTKDHPEEQ
jgi:hypothetical protein